MFAVIVNTLAIAIASLIGLCLRRGMTKNITDAVMQALGICTVLIGIQGAVSEKHVLLLIISVVIGVIIGEWGDWDGHVNRWAEKVTVACTKSGDAAGIHCLHSIFPYSIHHIWSCFQNIHYVLLYYIRKE